MADYDKITTKMTFKMFVAGILEEWLDSLSFYEAEIAEYYNLDDFKSVFRLLDKLLKDNDNGLCNAFFAPHGCNEGEVVVLVVNDKDNYYKKLGGYIHTDVHTVDFEQRAYSTLCNRITKLRKQGYKDLSELNE